MTTFLGSAVSLATASENSTPRYSFTSDTTYLHVQEPPVTRCIPKPQAYAPKKITSPRGAMDVTSQHHEPAARRKSNIQTIQAQYILVDLLQNIQGELTNQRRMIADIQSRLSRLEQEPNLNPYEHTQNAPESCTEKRISSKRTSRTENHIRQNWWPGCQSFAKTSDTSINVEEFLGRSRCFSGFDFDFDLRPSNLKSGDAAPKLFDLPPLTPASEQDPESGLVTPEYHQVAFSHNTRLRDRSKAADLVGTSCDIVEQIVEVDEAQRIVTPLLQSPPESRKTASARASYDRDVTALPAIPHYFADIEEASNTHRRSRSMQRLLSCKAVFTRKSRSSSSSSLD